MKGDFMDYEYNGKNGQATRMEMLISLDYLLNNCTSEKKTSKTTDLVEYAQTKYQTFIDRRRANGIFEDLVQISNNFPQLLPFLVKKVSNKPRYYVEKRLLDEQDVVRIANSIQSNKSLTKQASSDLLQRFLKVVFTEDQQKKSAKKIKKRSRGTQEPVTNQEMALIELLEDIKNRVCRFHFSFARSVRSDNGSGPFPLRGALEGYVYEVLTDSDDVARVCLYLDQYRVAVIVRLEELIIDKTFEPVPRINANTLTFELDGHRNIDDWVDNYLSGQSGYATNVEFKFYAGHLEYVKKAYKKFFKREMVYTIKDRIEEVPVFNPDNPEEKREIIVQDAYSSVNTNLRAFRKWYMDNGLFEYMVILSPASLNERLVFNLMTRFARRLNRYGGRYNVELNITEKPEYTAELAARRERIERFKREHPHHPKDEK